MKSLEHSILVIGAYLLPQWDKAILRSHDSHSNAVAFLWFYCGSILTSKSNSEPSEGESNQIADFWNLTSSSLWGFSKESSWLRQEFLRSLLEIPEGRFYTHLVTNQPCRHLYRCIQILQCHALRFAQFYHVCIGYCVLQTSAASISQVWVDFSSQSSTVDIRSQSISHTKSRTSSFSSGRLFMQAVL